MNSSNFLSLTDREEIERVISEAEQITSGEIRIHLENSCAEDVLDHTAWIFEKLEMHKTQDRNGILFYLATKDKKFSILADVGINQKLGEDYWGDFKTEIGAYFSKNDFKEGLIYGVNKIAQNLKEHFPIEDSDVNELPNEISIDSRNENDSE